MTKNVKPDSQKAHEALGSDEYFDVLRRYDQQLEALTQRIWGAEYLNV